VASTNSSGSKDRKSMPEKPMAGPVGRPEAVAQSAEVEKALFIRLACRALAGDERPE